MAGTRSTATPCVFVVLIGVAGMAIAKIAGVHLSPAFEWPLLLLTFAASISLCVKTCAERAYKPERILSVIDSLAASRDVEIKKLAREGMSEEMLRAIGGLDAAVKSLRHEKRRAEMVLSEIADGIIAVDAEGRVTLFNRAAESLLGVRASRILENKIETTDIHPEVARIAEEAIACRSVFSSEIRLPGLPERVIGIRAAPFSERGQGDSALLLLHDLSEIRRHEKMQKEFVSNVSHELRTPITAVRVTAEVLLGGARNDEQLVDQFLNNILSESDRLSALIDDVLEIAKRESGVIKTEKNEINVLNAVQRAFVTVRPQAEQNEVEVNILVPEDMVAYADNIQLVQLVRNLIDNAVKYTPSGGRVDVIGEHVDGAVRISVRDTGIGIPHGEVERIFERFYRVDKARSRRLGGTGLGLAIVKDIVDAHGGKISVETELGKGSTFLVTLPTEN